MEFKNIDTLKGHQAAVYALCEGGEDHYVFSAGSDRHVILWNLETKTAEKVVAKSPTTIFSILYLKSHNYLLIGQAEGGIHIIDLNVGKEIKYLKLHQGYVFDLKYLAHKKEIVALAADGSMSIWSIDDFTLLYHKKIADGKIRKADLKEDYMALALGDHTVSIYNTKDWSENTRITAFASPINVARFIPATNALLVGEKNAHLYLYDLGVDKVKSKIAAHNWAIYDLQFSSDNKYFATASRDKTVKIWDTAQMNVLKRFEGMKDAGHTHSVNALLWSSYKNYLISTGDDGSLKLWKISE